MASWFKSKEIQVPLLTFLCRDRSFLKKCGRLLSPKDFKPSRDETNERWIIATIALEFWTEYKSPVDSFLRPKVIEYCRKNNIDEKRKKALNKLIDRIHSGDKLVAVEAMEDSVIEYVKAKNMKDSIEELITKQEEGKLDDKTFTAICKRVVEFSGASKRAITSYLDEDQLSKRIARRKLNDKGHWPLLFLEGFDKKSRAITRGGLGLLLAPYKKGKSLGLAHIADAYCKQGLKGLYITTEDPQDEVEDRMDAAAAGIPINKLKDLPNKLKKRFKKFRKRISGQLKIIDLTEEDVITVDLIEQIWEQERDQGFVADFVIIDYDDELKDTKEHKGESGRRFEFAAIYRSLRKFAKRKDIYLWTAAQTRKVPDNCKIISGDKVAEDVSKIRKATLVIGIGQGEAHVDARYLFVAAAKRGPSRFGWEIMSNPSYGLFYDTELTHEIITLKKKVEEIGKKKRHKIAA